jgi:hypothetical protein
MPGHDTDVVRTSVKTHHPIVSGRAGDRVSGTAFESTAPELEHGSLGF